MTLTTAIVVVHVLSAIAMVAGIVGRELTRLEMSKTDALSQFLAYLRLVGRFDGALVRGGSSLLALSGILLALLEGYPLLGFLQGARANWLLAANVLFLSVMGLVILVFIPRGKLFERALEEARQSGQITPALRAAEQDPLVVWAHRWENSAIILVILLMVAKPF